MKTLIIIPAYNEGLNIERTINNIKTELKDYDYVVINDGSKDNTKEVLDAMHANHIDLPVNLGLSGAVQTGYKYAYEKGYDCAIQFDGDGQHRAEFIPLMVAKMSEGYDIVIGSRFITQKKDYSLRMIGSRIISFLIRLRTGKQINDPTSGMRLLNRNMLCDYAFNMNRKPEPDTLAYQIKNGAKVAEIQVKMNDREDGESMFDGLIPSAKYMLNMIISIIFLIY